VVLPCFDDGELLVDAIASVERVVRCSFEILIVDDGSSAERTLHILEALDQSGYRVIRRSENRGLSAARNRGMQYWDGGGTSPR
jgi:glycosyltransferase involved in cell wall biosynthesis